MSQNFDVLVIGAGIAGASVAAHLAEHMRVCILEMEDRPGYHSTSRSAATYEPNYGPPPILALTRASRSFFDAPLRGFADRPLLNPHETLFFMPEGQEEAAEALLAKSSGLIDLSAAQAKAKFPPLRAGYARRTLSDRGTADIDVDLLHQGYLKLFKRRGGHLRLKTEVLSLERNGGQWTAGDYHAPVIVNAAGAWADVVAARAGAAPLGLQPKRRSIGVVPAPEGLDMAALPMAVDVAETWYMKPQSGKFLISSADATPVEPHDAFADDMAIAEGIERFQIATEIEVTRVESTWGGLRSFFPDGVPVCGFDAKMKGFFWLAGQGGYGIQSAPALSALAAAQVLGKPVPQHLRDHGVDAASLSPQRFKTGATS